MILLYFSYCERHKIFHSSFRLSSCLIHFDIWFCQLTQDKKSNGYVIKQSAQQNEKRYYEVADSTDAPV